MLWVSFYLKTGGPVPINKQSKQWWYVKSAQCFVWIHLSLFSLLWLLAWMYELFAQPWEGKKGWKTVENQNDWYRSINLERWQTEVIYCIGRKGAERSRAISRDICVITLPSEHPPELSSILPPAAPWSHRCQILWGFGGSKPVPFALGAGQEVLSCGRPWLQPWAGDAQLMGTRWGISACHCLCFTRPDLGIMRLWECRYRVSIGNFKQI